MKRLQIIIIVLAVLSIAGLYSLPRVVIDNDEGETQDFGGSTLPEGGTADHSAEIPEEVLPRLEHWKNELILSGKIQNNESALDSLMLVFQGINKYDSAAHYAAAFADSYQEVKHWRKAGDAFYEAFTFSVDEAKSLLLAQKARTYYDKIFDSGVNDLDAKTNVAMLMVDSSTPMQGIMMLREILEEDPTHEKARLNMGWLSIRSQQFERGVEHFESLIENHPDNLEGNYYLGVCYFETGQLEKAKAQLEKVKTMDTDPMVQTAADEFLERINNN
ncbi:MAG: tetratricopeptide repeat protein [Roseivirga sp.]|nr:tetratricopeptide repeat protein [Roseivirga sp.]